MRYPRLAIRGTHLTEQQRLDWARRHRGKRDAMMLTNHWPGHINALKQTNPNLILGYEWMPQFGSNHDSVEPEKHLHRYISLLSREAGWLLKQTTGELVRVWWQPVLDMTEHCPRAPTGHQYAGMRFDEALPIMIMEWADTRGWGAGSGAIDMLVMDLWIETWWPGWLGSQRDQIRQGDTGRRYQFQDFVASWAERSAVCLDQIRDRVQLPIQVGGDRYTAHASRVHGLKIEDALHRERDWHREYEGVSSNNRGLLYARQECIDEEASTRFEGQWWPEHGTGVLSGSLQRAMRMNLATALLTDGYAEFNVLNTEGREPPASIRVADPLHIPEYDLDLGDSGSDVTVMPPGIYRRTFSRDGAEIAEVIVNPTDIDLPGLPAHDAIIRRVEWDQTRALNDLWIAASDLAKAGIMTAAFEGLSESQAREILERFGG